MNQETISYFSVRYDLIVVDKQLPFDLFVNSSALAGRERFVRIFPRGETLEIGDVIELKKKYLQLYVPEHQRHFYMQSLVRSDSFSDTQKTEVIKSSALQYLSTIFAKDREFTTEVLSDSIEGCREVVELMVDILDDYSIDDLRGLIGNLSFHDFYTFDHSINVSMYCIAIYRNLFPTAKREEIVHVGLGGLLHDLGKIKIATSILNKPGKLSEEEYLEIKKHPTYGIDLLLSGEVKVHESIDVKIIARVIHEHHENYDGTGYPNRLKEEQIHLMARVCTIADFFDALTTKRAYNQVITVAESMNVLRKYSGIKLDPKILEAFERHLKYVRSDYIKDLKLDDHFDPTLPYIDLPIQEIKFEHNKDFGKIKIMTSAIKDKK